MDALRINYNPTELSVRAALLAGYNVLTFGLWIGLSFGVLVVVLEISSVNWSSMQSVLIGVVIPFGLALLGGFAMAILGRYLLLPLKARNIFRKNPILFGPSVLLVDGEGLKVTSPNTSVNFRWNELRGYKEVKGALVFAPRGVGYYAVPTSEIAANDLQALRQILNDRAPLLNS